MESTELSTRLELACKRRYAELVKERQPWLVADRPSISAWSRRLAYQLVWMDACLEVARQWGIDPGSQEVRLLKYNKTPVEATEGLQTSSRTIS